VIGMLSGEASVRKLCELVGCAVSSFYYHPCESSFEIELRDQIEQICLEFPRYGYRRVSAELRRRGYKVNRKKVYRIMKDEDLLFQVKRYCRTSIPGVGNYPNLLKDLEIYHPDQVWCGDITYIKVSNDFVYLSVLMDVFTRSVRGWELSRSLDDNLTVKALEKALREGKPQIHHSDHGIQYLSERYISMLEDAGIKISMAAKGKAWENGYAERLIRTLKEEEVYLHEYENFEDAYAHIGKFLGDVYMQRRAHSSLGYLTPSEFEAEYHRSSQKNLLKKA